MNRRQLLERALAGAAAFVAAPAVNAEAARLSRLSRRAMPTLLEGDVWVLSSEIRQARAEGYERGRAVEQARAESRAKLERPYREVGA